MLFNAGFMANQAVVRHLPGKDDLVLVDRLIHHSIAQALLQGPANFKRYDHLDMLHLEELIEKNHTRFNTIFVFTESVFSMDGDYPDLQHLVRIKKKNPFILVLDEAHGTGVYGVTGAGLAEEASVSDEIDIIVGTLGKALASMGAYVLAKSSAIIEYLINHSGEFIYSTYLTPAQAGAASAAVEILQESGQKRASLRDKAVVFRRELNRSGWKTNNFDSPIIPILVGDIQRTLDLRDHFLEKGIIAGAVRPPTVPKGTSRIRLSLHSELEEDQLSNLLILLNQWKTH